MDDVVKKLTEADSLDGGEPEPIPELTTKMVKTDESKMLRHATDIIYAVVLIDKNKQGWATMVYAELLREFVETGLMMKPEDAMDMLMARIDAKGYTGEERVMVGMLLGIVLINVLDAMRESI